MRVPTDLMGPRVQLGHKGFKDCRGLPDQQGPMGSRGQTGPRGHRDPLDLLEPTALTVQRVLKAFRDSLAPQGQRGRWEPLVRKASKD